MRRIYIFIYLYLQSNWKTIFMTFWYNKNVEKSLIEVREGI